MTTHRDGRFYESEFPEVEDIVVVQVKRIVDMGAYVSLLEYDGREGMMLLSELSKRRIRSVAKLLRVGRTEICMVLRADQDKGYIDLSKRRVEPADARLKDESFAKAKSVHGVMAHVARLHSIEPEELCNKVSWPLYRKYEDAHHAFQMHVNQEINMWNELTFKEPGQDLSHLEEKLKEDIEISLKRRLIQAMLRMRAKVDVSCSQFEGINAIKEALTKGFAASTEECEVKIKLIAHPTFMLSCTSRDKNQSITVLNEAIRMIEESITSKGGEFEVKSRPEAVGDEKEEEEGSGSSSSSDGDGDDDSDGNAENQDETMGDLDDAQMKELMEKKVDESDDEEKEEKKGVKEEKKGKKEKKEKK